MMSNTNVFYHPESISFMQLFVLLIIWFYQDGIIPDHFSENEDKLSILIIQ